MISHRVKSFLLAALLAISAAGSIAADDAPSSKSTDALQAELDALFALMSSTPPPGTAGADHYRWFDQLTRKVGADAFSILEKYPQDPRRWRAALVVVQRRFHPRFVVSIGDDYPTAGEKTVVRDKAAEAAWDRRVEALERKLRAANDVPGEVREQLEFADLMLVFQPAYGAAHEKKPFDAEGFDAAFRGFLSRWPDSDSGRGLVPMYVRIRTLADNVQEEEVLREFVDSPNRGARDYVRDRLRFFELSKKPFELAFTALDGRRVDLANLRGKVVLIDFWATWCGPCIAELPNVKKVYAEYSSKGFEIIGVSLDAEKDRQKFKDLVESEGVSWPQRFEGKGWKDPLAESYTISGIPAMFLLDQDGMLVSTNARGEKLEQEVKSLLKL